MRVMTEPQRYSWGMQKNENGEPQRYSWETGRRRRRMVNSRDKAGERRRKIRMVNPRDRSGKREEEEEL